MRILSIILLIIAMSQNAFGQIIPRPLSKGDKIAIITPSSRADSLVIESGMATLTEWGYEPVPLNHVFHTSPGSYTAPDSARAADIMEAFLNPEYKAVLCSRGGYGSTRLLPYLDIEAIRANPKWLIGFSDISALHAYLQTGGMASIHGPMLGQLSRQPEDTCTLYLKTIIEEGLPLKYEFPFNGFNKKGQARGKLVGGNFIVVNNLAQTPYDVLNLGDQEDIILFLEDVGEKIYAIERMLLRLHQSGVLHKVKGIIFGEFTNYKPDEDYETMEEMIYHWLNEWGYYNLANMPIAYGIPVGHDTINYPIVLGAQTLLTVDNDATTIEFLDE